MAGSQLKFSTSNFLIVIVDVLIYFFLYHVILILFLFIFLSCGLFWTVYYSLDRMHHLIFERTNYLWGITCFSNNENGCSYIRGHHEWERIGILQLENYSRSHEGCNQCKFGEYHRGMKWKKNMLLMALMKFITSGSIFCKIDLPHSYNRRLAL